MQPKQRSTTGHIFEAAIGSPPIEPIADSPGKRTARQARLGLHSGRNPCDEFVAEFLSNYLHAPFLAPSTNSVQQNCGTCSVLTEGLHHKAFFCLFEHTVTYCARSTLMFR